MTTSTPERIAVSPQEAARMVGVSLKTVQAAMRSGALPALQHSPRVTRIKVADLEAWLDAWTPVVDDD